MLQVWSKMTLIFFLISKSVQWLRALHPDPNNSLQRLGGMPQDPKSYDTLELYQFAQNAAQLRHFLDKNILKHMCKSLLSLVTKILSMSLPAVARF